MTKATDLTGLVAFDFSLTGLLVYTIRFFLGKNYDTSLG